MKYFSVLLVSACFFVVGCGSGESSPSRPSNVQPGKQQEQQKPVQSPVVDNPFVAVELNEGYIQWKQSLALTKRDNVYFPERAIWAGESGVDSAQVEFSASAVVADPSSAFIQGRYGCSSQRVGDIYFRQASLGYVTIEKNAYGASVAKVTAYELLDVFRICSGRNVAIAFDLYQGSAKNPEARVIVYLRRASS